MTSIEADLRHWSKTVLEIPNKHLKGLPACPYAKAAWAQNKVKVIEHEDIYAGVLTATENFWKHDFDLIIVASFKIPPFEEFDTWLTGVNDAFTAQDLHLMGFHPEYGAEDADLDFLYTHEWESEIEDEYCMVFVQSLSQVDDASLLLEKKGYYDAFHQFEYEDLVLKRRERRNGNETSGNEKEASSQKGHDAWRHGEEEDRDDARRHGSEEKEEVAVSI